MERQVMAIGNVTPDSFYSASRLSDTESVIRWAAESLENGAKILDIGGCSTRPNSTPASEQEEWGRIEPAIAAIRKTFPDALLSLDTFRPTIAKRTIEQFGEMIINDVSGGEKAMYEVVKYWNVPYVWTLNGQLDLPSQRPQMMDMNIILDPGFGFIGSVEKDYACLRRLHTLTQYGKPVLVGVSRKSMLYKPLGITPEECLVPSQTVHFYALQQGATILRTHDVKETMQTIALYNTIHTI